MNNSPIPVPQRILALLSDGLPHSRHEIHACLWDEQANLTTIQFHISLLRKQLRPRGEEIVCEVFKRTIHYRHVRLLKAPS